MAALTTTARGEIQAEFMRDRSLARDVMALSKADLLAAINALDDFLSANAATINATIPQPARGALTTPQKALLLQFVIQRRYVDGA